MRQVVVASFDDITTERVPAPSPGPGEALVHSTLVGICGSDLHAAQGRHPHIPLPYRPGHEAVGVVRQLGPGATGVQVGDRVVVEPNLYCGTCPPCEEGRYNICRELAVFGCQTAGAMSDLFTIPAHRLHTLPDALSDTAAALVEPAATAVHAVRRAGDLDGRRVAVLGAGPIGLLVLAVARRAGARCVSSDPLEGKRRLAEGAGALAGVPSGAADFTEQVHKALDGPADVVFDCVATEPSMAQATALVAKGGTVMVVGVPAGPVAVRLDLVQDWEIQVTGNLMYVRDDMREALAMAASGEIPTRELVTATYPLDQAGDAFRAAREPGQTKVLVRVGEEDGTAPRS
jgi:2-desacetyl-2-hydroxyethyl bacteriochlorophyllide A dehydrogenase